MDPIIDPVRIKPAKLREFAYQAAWIATATEAATELEDFLVDVPAEERELPNFRTPWPWDFDPLIVALSVVRLSREEAERNLEERLAPWFGEDRQHWPVFQFTLLDL